MTVGERAGVALARALALAALACCGVACRIPVPATPCAQDLDCPDDHRCHLGYRVCVVSDADAGGADALHVEGGVVDAAQGDALRVDAGATDATLGDARQVDVVAADVAHGDLLQADGGAVDSGHDAGLIVDPGCSCGACEFMNGSLTLGNTHSCALNAAGRVLCWGNNGTGELGNTGPDLQLVPTQVCLAGADCDAAGALTGIAAVSAGDYHTCALTGQGRVWCWGNNSDGQLGTGDTQTRWNPAQVCAWGIWDPVTRDCGGGLPLSGVVGIDAGSKHTCALMADGSLRCWGSNTEGKLGDGSLEGRPNPAAVCVSGQWDPAAQHCGPDGYLLVNAQRVSAGYGHTCALLLGGELSCWGSNSVGQLGVGVEITSSPSPVEVCILGDASPSSLLCEDLGAELMAGVTEVAAGGFFTCALTERGYAWCWGGDSYAQLGDGSTLTGAVNPVQVCLRGDGCTDANQLRDVTALSAGMYHSCARLQDGELRCWGINDNGELGDGTLEQPICNNDAECRPNPVATCAAGTWEVGNEVCSGASLESVAAVAAGLDHSCALLTDGSLRCWGMASTGLLGRDSTGGTECATGQCQLNPVMVCSSGSGDDCAGAPLSLGCAPP